MISTVRSSPPYQLAIMMGLQTDGGTRIVIDEQANGLIEPHFGRRSLLAVTPCPSFMPAKVVMVPFRSTLRIR